MGISKETMSPPKNTGYPKTTIGIGTQFQAGLEKRKELSSISTD
jgi:hypothetical protein